MIHFNTSNHNMFYFNKTDITNGYLFIPDDILYVYKTILYMCKVSYTVDSQNNDVYNEILNTRYIRLDQNDISSKKHQLILVQQQDNDTKTITIQFQNKKNKIDLTSFIASDIIKDDEIWCVLLRDYEQLNQQSDNTQQTVQIYEFNADNLNTLNQLVLNYSDLGVEKNVQITIENNSNEIVNDNSINYVWDKGNLIIQFPNKQIVDGNWKLKYLVPINNKKVLNGEYYPATFIKINQLDDERANNIIDNFLTPSIVEYRQITIHHEVATHIYGNQFKFSYQNWNDGQVYVFLNNNPIRLAEDMYTVDKQYGKIYTNFQPTIGDNIMCTYNFDYFPSHVLYGFLKRAVSQINAGPVGTMSQYTLETCPEYWNGLIADYAYTYCLDKLILQYDLWKGRLVFAIGPQGLADGNDNIISQLESQRNAAWDRINITINNPKFKAKEALAYPTQYYIDGISPMGRYPGLSGRGITGGKLRGLRINRMGGTF